MDFLGLILCTSALVELQSVIVHELRTEFSSSPFSVKYLQNCSRYFPQIYKNVKKFD